MFIHLCVWERERQNTSGDRERDGDTESEAGSRLRAVSTEPDAGLELTDREIMTWAEAGRLTDGATQAPLMVLFTGLRCDYTWGRPSNTQMQSDFMRSASQKKRKEGQVWSLTGVKEGSRVRQGGEGPRLNVLRLFEVERDSTSACNVTVIKLGI